MAATETVELVIGQPVPGLNPNSILFQKQNSPYPHWVIDNAIDDDALSRVFYTLSSVQPQIWIEYNNDFERKKTTRNLGALSIFASRLIMQMQSAIFVDAIKNLTGVQDLVVDPGLHGMGYYRYESNGFLAPHMGYELHPILNLERRVSVLLFLNPDWNASWGGEHLIWDDNGLEVKNTIRPTHNRMLVYQNQDNGWMSVRPVQTPADSGQFLIVAATTYLTNPRSTATRKRSVFIPNRGYEFA